MHPIALPGWIFLLALPVISPAQALELTGRYGYAGEWAVTATLAAVGSGWRGREFSGQIRLKHLALCGPGEVAEKSGEIRLSRRSGERYAASLMLAGETCSVAGELAEEAVAFADCGAQGRIPLRLWPK